MNSQAENDVIDDMGGDTGFKGYGGSEGVGVGALQALAREG